MWTGDWSSDVCSSDLPSLAPACVRRGRSSGCDRVEVELPVGARVECVLQAAAGGEAEGGGGLVGEGGRSEERRGGKECECGGVPCVLRMRRRRGCTAT